MLKNRQRQYGFTIVELLIVIVVIAILAAITIVAYNGVTQRAVEVSLKSDLQNTARKLAIYHTDNGSYPGTLTDDLKAQSSNTSLFYESTSSTTFCLSATSSNAPTLAFRITEAGTIQTGACPGASVSWAQVSAGYNHTLALTSNGKVYAWGSNGSGQVGDGTTNTAVTPVDISSSGSLAGKTIVRVSAGYAYSLAVASDGTVHAWGDNNSSRLGNGTTNPEISPINISSYGSLSGKSIVKISAGNTHNLALASDNTVHAWGNNMSGSVGDGTWTSTKSTPVNITNSGSLNGKTVTQIGVGLGHSIALTSDGTMHAWGTNGYGQLGDGTTNVTNVPIPVNSYGSLAGKTVTQIGTGFGANTTFAVASDGTVHGWGDGNYGKIGDGFSTSRTSPVEITSSGSIAGKTIIKILAGASYSIALASDGTVHTWGRNNYSQLGNGSVAQQLNPIAVSSFGTLSGKTIDAISVGYYHNFAHASDGTIHGWGYNALNQLGDGTTTNRSTAITIALP